MKKLLGIVVLTILWCNMLMADIEKRVTAYMDDGNEAWFTFQYEPKDIFTFKRFLFPDYFCENKHVNTLPDRSASGRRTS